MRISRGKLIVWLAFLLLGIYAQPAQAGVAGLTRTTKTALYDLDTITVNNIGMFVTNTGSFAWDVATGNPGLIFPWAEGEGTKTAVFASGLWIGAKVNGEIRIAVSEYSDEYVPGVMRDSTFSPDEPRFKIYKIYRGDTTSSDYLNWPVEDGAPVDSNGKPLFLGDVTLWAVYNDADPSAHSNNAGETAPLGVEIQQTTFAFDREDPLGNVIFLKFKIINKGPNTLDSTYISLWSDPDVGGAMDDLVGCDTSLSVGFAYNATNTDELYGSTPPCVGYDFFQGPIVPGDSTDTAWVSGVPKPGYRNLPMVSFNKYINGTDPTSASETYNYMKGLNPDGTIQTDPTTGQPTNYMVSGDPVAGTGWLDANPADRRFMLSAGPFTMAPGDTQEVVAAIVLGKGGDRLTSISAMKYNDRFAQKAFDENFILPHPPKAPVVKATALDRKVVLTWGLDSEIEHGTYTFEGYNVYQGASAAGPWKRIATYDVNNGVAIIFDDVFDPEAGVVINQPVQFGSDHGLVHFIEITQDKWRGGPLHNGTPYYFKVGAYSYDPAGIPKTLEKTTTITIIPQPPIAENSYSSVYADSVATHVAGRSDGSVEILVIDPSEVTGHTYQVIFDDTSGSETTWDLIDVTTGDTILSDQTNQSGDDSYQITDGLLVKVKGPTLGVKSVVEVQNASGPVDPPDNVHYSLNSTGDWYINPFGDLSLERYTWAGATTHDYEIRFVQDATEYCWDWFGAGNYSYVAPFKVPIEVWDIGISTVDDPSDDVRITFMIIDDDSSNSFSWGDGIYFRDIPYDDVAWTTPGLSSDTYVDDFSDLHYGRFWFFDYSGNLTRPDPGTIVRILTNKVNTSEDVFIFETRKMIQDDFVLAKENLDKVNVVPNPYFNASTYEPNPFNRVIKFTHLPRRCTIRIFNLAGDLVRVLYKDDDQSYFTWDVKTEWGLPVASGIYIYHVDAPGIGTKVGKMAIFTEKERLNTY